MNPTQSDELLDPVRCDGAPDVVPWSRQQFFWSEHMRGGALGWRASDPWFVNDPLSTAPRAHAHPDASEYYFLASGSLDVTVGSTDFTMAAGDICLIPPGAYHDPRGTNGSDAALFVVVSPNWRGRRWQVADFQPAAFAAEPALARVEPGPLPSDELLGAECVELAPGDALERGCEAGFERVVYVLDGTIEAQVDHMRGELTPHRYLHLPAGTRHRLRATGERPARLLCIRNVAEHTI